MQSCPFCGADLGEPDLQAGKCSSCGKGFGRETAGEQGSGGDAPRDQAAPGGGDEEKAAPTMDDHPLTKTVDLGGAAPAGEGDQRESDDQRFAQTMDSDSTSLEPPSKADAGTADDPRAAQTLESGELPPEEAEKLSLLWSGKYQPESTPWTSIKADSLSVETSGELVIQPRAVREPKEKRKAGADYELMHQLGEGGMGVVYAARQASIDRTVAIKMLKTTGKGDQKEQAKFLSEAVVTGDLEHPNIVPIYDLGRNEAGALFYAMKRVKGTPWNTVIRRKSLSENLDTLMRVADAVAFAHSRGVTHRDLKPENVMLGDFGEVLLMDWGLAMSPATAPRTVGMGGTPAYMAPEMASGPIERIGFASDIYLLGAILYEIVTGKAPHVGKGVMACLRAAAKNEIQATPKSGELLQIARIAMATDPRDRYPAVADFQDAIREYQSHTESISLSVRAEEDLERAEEREDYQTFARALFAYQEALSLWEGNARARAGISRASLAYAASALGKGDYDLAASLLDAGNAEHADLLRRIEEAQLEREARRQRLRAAKQIGAALAVTVFVVVTVAFFWIRAEADRARRAEGVAETRRQEAVAQKKTADEQRDKAEVAEREADTQRAEAVAQKKVADDQRDRAEASQQEAEAAQKEAEEQRAVAVDERAKAVEAQKQEEYEAYIARIGQAAAKIEENAFDRAVELLEESPKDLRNWEWGRLMHLCTQEVRAFDAQQPVDAVAFSPDASRFVTGGWGGTARIWDAETGRDVVDIPTGGQYIFAAAFSPDGTQVATGGNSRPGYVKIWDAETGELVRALEGHGDAVLSVAYSGNGKRLLTSSYDNTARLWDLESGESQSFAGHEWWVWTAAFSPDEKRIVTASQDGSAIVWSVESGEAGPPFWAHSGPVYAAAFSPDGQIVATGGYDKRVLLWRPEDIEPFDYETLSSEKEMPPPAFKSLEGHHGGVRSVEFSADGRLLLTGSDDNTVRVWDVATRRSLKVLRGHGGQVRTCRFAPGDQRVLSGSHDHQAKIWDLAGYEEVRVFRGRVLEGHEDAVLGAAFSPDGRRIVTASRDRTAKTWDFKTGKEIRLFREGHEFLASAACFFPDGKRLVTAAVDNTTRIWDVANGTQLLALEGTGPSAAVALSADAKWILTGSDAQTAKLWDAETGELLRTLQGHRIEVSAVAISPDGKYLFTADRKGQCRLWDSKSGEERWRAEGHSRGVTCAAFLPGGEWVLTASLDNTVGQWNVSTGRERLKHVLKHPDAVTSIALSPDGRQALTTCADKTVRLWDVETADLMRVLVRGEEMINAVAFSPDGRRALTVGSDNTVRIWEVESGREIGIAGEGGRPLIDLSASGDLVWSAVFSPSGSYIVTVGGSDAHLWDVDSGRRMMRFTPHGSVASARFSPDGKRVITGSWDHTARIWNSETGVAELKLEGEHSGYVNDAVFSPDGSKVLTASDDKTVRLWDAGTGQMLLALEGHREHVRGAEFSSDGNLVLTASDDKTARIWSARTGELLRVLEGHGQAVLCAAFSQVGSRVITGSEDNTGRIWDAETGKEILTLAGHSQAITTVAFSPDGRSVLTGSRDGTLIIWLAVGWDGK